MPYAKDSVDSRVPFDHTTSFTTENNVLVIPDVISTALNRLDVQKWDKKSIRKYHEDLNGGQDDLTFNEYIAGLVDNGSNDGKKDNQNSYRHFLGPDI